MPDEADPMTEGPSGDPSIPPLSEEGIAEAVHRQALEADADDGFWEGAAEAAAGHKGPVPAGLLEGED